MSTNMSFLDDILNIENPTIQESIFVTRYLPMFASSQVNHVAHWLEVCKYPGAAVDVYRGDEYLFTVPPLLDTELLSFQKDVSISNIVGTIEAASKVYPHLANTLAENKLLPLIQSKAPNPEYLKQWNDILVRYNQAPLPVDTKTLVDNTSTEQSLDVDDEDW